MQALVQNKTSYNTSIKVKTGSGFYPLRPCIMFLYAFVRGAKSVAQSIRDAPPSQNHADHLGRPPDPDPQRRCNRANEAELGFRLWGKINESCDGRASSEAGDVLMRLDRRISPAAVRLLRRTAVCPSPSRKPRSQSQRLDYPARTVNLIPQQDLQDARRKQPAQPARTSNRPSAVLRHAAPVAL